MAFPTTMIVLDTFKRTEATLSNGAKWTVINGFGGTGECKEEDWIAKAETSGAFWNVKEFVEPAVSVDIIAPLGGVGKEIVLWACCTKFTTTEKTGYRLLITETEVGKKEATYKLIRVDKGVETPLVEKTKASHPEAGDKVAIQVRGGKVIAWHKVGAGAWAEVVSTTDETYRKGNVAFGASASGSLRLQNFSVGIEAVEKLKPSLGPGAPVMNVLESFRRANETPLASASWTIIAGLTFTGEVNGEAYTAKDAFPNEDGAFWNPLASVENPFVIASVEPELSSSERLVVLWACLHEPTSATEKSGYKMTVTREATAGLFKVKTALMSKTVLSNETETTAVPIAAGEQIGLQVVGGKVKAWRIPAGGGKPVLIHEKADATFTTGFIGLGAAGTGTAKLRYFGLAQEPLISRKTTHGIIPTMTPAVVLTKAFALVRTLLPSLSPAVTTSRVFGIVKAFAPSLTPAASLTRSFAFVKTLSPSLSPSAVLGKNLGRVFAASLTPSASRGAAVVRGTAASINPSAVIRRSVVHALAPSLSPAASMVKVLALVRAFSPSLAPAATLTKALAFVRHLTPSLAPSAVLVKVLGITRTFPASLQPTASANRATTHGAAASLSPSGSLRRSIVRGLSASLEPTATLVRNSVQRFAASIAPSVTFTKVFAHVQRFAASLSPAAGMSRSVSHGIAAALNPEASMAKRFALVRRIQASLGPEAGLAVSIVKRFAVALAPLGALKPNSSGTIVKRFVATLSPEGTLTKWVSRWSGFPQYVRRMKLFTTTERDDPGAS